MGLYDEKPCPCKSGKMRRPRFDGYGIFLTFVCDDCEEEKMSKYRKDIEERYETDEQIEDDY
jgi:hypothetical protein